MTDTVSPEKRSLMMSAVRGKDTQPELRVRKALHAAGFRFRLHCKDLPGRPDVVLSKHKLVVFVHGCFWHGHSECRLAKIPATRPEFWAAKLKRNAQRDRNAINELRARGWRVLVIWQCYLQSEKNADSLQLRLAVAVESPDGFIELRS